MYIANNYLILVKLSYFLLFMNVSNIDINLNIQMNIYFVINSSYKYRHLYRILCILK